MENYSKGKNVEEPLEKDKIPIPNLPENFLWMTVSIKMILTNKLFDVHYGIKILH